MKMNNLKYVIIGFMAIAGCTSSTENNVEDGADMEPIKVEIRKEQGAYQLYRGGRPYEIKGAGLTSNIKSLQAHGGNSIRTWSVENGQEVLDKALEHGMTVSMGFYIQPERHGMDYNDDEKVRAQFERVRKGVLKYKDHPALLTWIIGNELNHHYTNPKVYDAVNEISEMIHDLDPNHPTTTTVSTLNLELADEIRNRAADLDFLSVQMYGAIHNLGNYIEQAKWDDPFMITEWGAIGHWEVGQTEWGAPIEQHSSAKALNYLKSYQAAIEPFAGQCIGNYVFLWGQKQERTPTWYGLFLPTGHETEPTDVMHYLWNNQWPENRAPRVDSMMLDGKFSYDNIYLEADNEYEASIHLFEYDQDSLTFHWEVMHESTETTVGGDPEEVPDSVAVTIVNENNRTIKFVAPSREGAYRIFVYAFDGNGHAAHANIPFYVNPK